MILLIGIVFLLLSGLLISYILYKQGKRKHLAAEKYKNKMEEKHKLLTKKHEQLEDVRKMQIDEINRELQNAWSKYTKERREFDFERREKITRMVYKEVLNYENKTVFVKKMNRLLNNLPSKLSDKYPNITYKEISWCCLFILEVPTTDVLSILEYKQSSLYKFKQRLGNKVGYPIMKDLEEMLYQEAKL